MRAPILVLFLVLLPSLAQAQNLSITSSLAQALKAKRPGHYPLDRPWTGVLCQTISTGSFKKQNVQKPIPVLFDVLVKDNSSVHGGTLAKRSGNQAASPSCTYRPALPSDEEIVGTRTESALEELLGGQTGRRDRWEDGTRQTHSQAHRFAFSLKETNMVEVLQVTCSTVKRETERDWRIEAVQIRRGTATFK